MLKYTLLNQIIFLEDADLVYTGVFEPLVQVNDIKWKILAVRGPELWDGPAGDVICHLVI